MLMTWVLIERYFTLSVIYLIVECTRRQRKGNSKNHSDSCRPVLAGNGSNGLSYNYNFLNKRK